MRLENKKEVVNALKRGITLTMPCMGCDMPMILNQAQCKTLESALVRNVLIPCKGAVIDMPLHTPTEGVQKVSTNLLKCEYDGDRLMGFSCELCVERQRKEQGL